MIDQKTQIVSDAGQNAMGLAAKQLCSLVFISDLEPQRAKSLYINPLISPFNLDLDIDIDYSGRKVTVSCQGYPPATAIMRDGVGCTITTKLDQQKALPNIHLPAIEDKPLPRADQTTVTDIFSPTALEKALDIAFMPEHNTLAVVVLHKGKLITERYAPGITPATPLPGWSMAKSLTATFIGMLVARGILDIHQPGIVPEWKNNSDGSESVTLDHLLRMTSGLDVPEDQTGSDPNSRMIFVEPNAAKFAAQRGTKFPPSAHWEYMSGSTILACRAIYQATGGTLAGNQTFFREALMKPLGAPTFRFETDATGTFIGSSYAMASPHDWAKFGQLYLNGGIWEGEHLLPEGWIEYVTTHTPESESNSYGAGFWTVNHSSNFSHLPQDSFYANGFQGQYVFIVPSLSLVIVRLGATLGLDGFWTMLNETIKAMKV